jgi:hypothetical protein
MELAIMNNTDRTARDWDNRLESFAAELTSALYPLVLRHGLKDYWLNVELGLWRALEATVKKWARELPPDSFARETHRRQESFLADLTDSALSIALANGFEGSALELVASLAQTLRMVFRNRSVAVAPGADSKRA